MTRLSGIEDLERLYAERGDLHYGEGVTQIEHALQCATLVEEQGAPPSLIAAALLHDVGHLFEREDDVMRSDDRHQVVGAQAIARLFGEDVCQPIALHVAAKRYLCFREPHYFEGLSPASKQSLKLQGGAFDEAAAANFELLPCWRDAVVLRRADDLGKRDDISERSFADFTPLLRTLLIGASKT